jgi:hypothetical protein
MNIFKKNVQMNYWELAPIKLAMICVGIAIGATWPEIFGPYNWVIFGVGLATGLYALYSWLKK